MTIDALLQDLADEVHQEVLTPVPLRLLVADHILEGLLVPHQEIWLDLLASPVRTAAGIENVEESDEELSHDEAGERYSGAITLRSPTVDGKPLAVRHLRVLLAHVRWWSVVEAS